jgi:hypothetical protein
MSVDNLPVQLVFMIAVPQDLNKEYMKYITRLAEYFRDDIIVLLNQRQVERNYIMKCNTLKKLWLMLLLLSLSFIPVFAVNEEAGTTGFANLRMCTQLVLLLWVNL